MEFETLRIDDDAVDEDLQDAGTVGPELAHLSGVYRRSPRALAWHRPSPDWRLFLLLPPLASRLSLIANPIFAQLTRAWGLNVRFVGVDRDGLAYDFRNLLSDRTLRMLVELLDAELADDPAVLDTLFASLAGEMLNLLERRQCGWGRHLDVEHRLEPGLPATLFARETRHPDFLSMLRAALRDELIDAHFYGRALRSIDARELDVERRIADLLQRRLDPGTTDRLLGTGAGLHLGCYNWLLLGGRHAPARAHVLRRLPWLATFLAESLVPADAALLSPGAEDWDDGSAAASDATADVDAPPRPPQARTLDLRAIAARSASAHSLHWTGVLRRAIDAGQDRSVIEALAQRFAVGDNLIRRLWREAPAALGQPPTWHLRQVLRQLEMLAERDWPQSDAQWRALLARAVPAEAH
jgi:hypothetical protein